MDAGIPPWRAGPGPRITLGPVRGCRIPRSPARGYVVGAQDFGTHAPTAVQRAIIALFHGTVLGRCRLRRLAVARFKAERPGPVDARLFGLRVRFHPHDNQCDAKAAVCGPGYNRDELERVRRHLPPGGTFVDVGANMASSPWRPWHGAPT